MILPPRGGKEDTPEHPLRITPRFMRGVILYLLRIPNSHIEFTIHRRLANSTVSFAGQVEEQEGTRWLTTDNLVVRSGVRAELPTPAPPAADREIAAGHPQRRAPIGPARRSRDARTANSLSPRGRGCLPTSTQSSCRRRFAAS